LPGRALIVIPAGNSWQQFPAVFFGSTFLDKQKAWKNIYNLKEYELKVFIYALV